LFLKNGKMQKKVWRQYGGVYSVSVNFIPMLGERFFAAYLHITV
jgi:hypothetical protein